MSKDEKDTITNNIWTEEDTKKVLQEINFDSWDANGSPVTVSATISPYETDTITVTTHGGQSVEVPLDGLTINDELVSGSFTNPHSDYTTAPITVNTAELDQGANGTKQLDLFDTVDFDETKFLKED